MRAPLPSVLRRSAAILLLFSTFAVFSGCARQDRCFIDDPRYARMKTLFVQTGSYQRCIDAMNDEQWPRCERNEFSYRLRKDLFLNEEDFVLVPVGKEPPNDHDRDLDDAPNEKGKTLLDNF